MATSSPSTSASAGDPEACVVDADVDIDLRSEMINSAAISLSSDAETVSFSKEVAEDQERSSI